MIKRIFSLALCFAVSCTLLSVAATGTDDEKAVETTPSAESVSLLSIENERFTFEIEENTGRFWVHDKKNGTTYSSNPADDGSGFNKETLYSLMTVEYFTSASERITLNSYDHSAVYGNMSVEKKDGKIYAEYIFGKFVVDKTMIPTAFTEEEFKKLLSQDIDTELFEKRYKLTEADDDKDGELKEKYPLLEKQPLYILHQYTPDYDVETIYRNLKGIGFTHDMLLEHNKKHEIEVEYSDNTQITVPLVYSLNEDGFSATIDCERLDVMGNATLTMIRPLPFYEAGFQNEDGYMLLPDGSGALINFDNDRLSLNGVTVPIYGADDAISVAQKWTYDQRATMPIFGISKAERGTLAIIEEGDALATLAADIGGRTSPVCSVSAGFTVRAYERITLDSVSSKTSYNIYSDKSYDGLISIKYVLLDKGRCEYDDMASAYREYLLENGTLTVNCNGEYPLSVELLGAIGKRESFLGIEYTKTYPLTTFSDAVTLINSLKGTAIDDITLKYNGWFNGGLVQQYADKINVVKKLGGEKGLKTLNRTLDNLGITCYYDAKLQTINQNLINSKVNIFSKGAKFVYKDIATLSLYDLSTAYPLDEKMFGTTPEEPKKYILSPKYLSGLLGSLKLKSEKLGNMNLGYSDIGSMLYSDFSSKSGTVRQESLEKIEAMLSEDSGFSVTGGDIYTLKNADCIFGLATQSSKKLLYDREVPFTQLVLHGIIPYTSEAINLSGDPETAILKAVETGSLLHYTFAYRNADELKNSDFNYYFSVSFDSWKQSISENYHKIAISQKELACFKITEHEYLTDKVTKTVYDDGTVVIVNYDTVPFAFGNATVPARDFMYFN